MLISCFRNTLCILSLFAVSVSVQSNPREFFLEKVVLTKKVGPADLLTVSNGMASLKLPLNYLKDSVFTSIGGEPILMFESGKAIAFSTLTTQDFLQNDTNASNPSIRAINIPNVIFNQDKNVTALDISSEARKQIDFVADSVGQYSENGKVLYVANEHETYYVVYGLQKSHVFITDKNAPDVLTVLVIDEFSKKDLLGLIVKGML